jgi:geranylgeranyl diphosphate synthase, type II
MELREQITKQTKYCNSIIEKYLPKEEGYQKEIEEAMNYSVLAGGKRLRPMLMLETYRLFGGISKDIYPFMTAIECIHTYSLVHDDLPAMDNDDYRRGKLTTHKKFGHAMGVLAGDGLLNYAYELCAKALVESTNINASARAFHVLSLKSGIYGMVGGQTVDVSLNGKNIDIDTLNFIYDLKTGALIEASMMCGAILAGANEADINTIQKIAKLIGLSFQIQDDILDVTSTTDELGKNVMSDQKNNKTTYVTIYGINEAKKIQEDLSRKAIELIDLLPYKNEFLRELVLSLITRKK